MENQQQHLFIDFEFTMPEKNKKNPEFYPEIIEAGIVVVQEGKIVEQYSSFVTPTKFSKLTERCKSFLNISQRQVDHGIPFAQLVEKLKGYQAYGPTIVVTWGNMDMRVLRSNCEKSNLKFPFMNKEIDLSMEYKRFFGDQNQTGLWKAVQEYGKEGTGKHHRALDDALTTYNIFKLVEKDKRYLEKPEPTTIGDRIDFSKVFNKFA
jgi:sporulation inhibitor KapD